MTKRTAKSMIQAVGRKKVEKKGESSTMTIVEGTMMTAILIALKAVAKGANADESESAAKASVRDTRHPGEAARERRKKLEKSVTRLPPLVIVVLLLKIVVSGAVVMLA